MHDFCCISILLCRPAHLHDSNGTWSDTGRSVLEKTGLFRPFGIVLRFPINLLLSANSSSSYGGMIARDLPSDLDVKDKASRVHFNTAES